MRRLNSYMVIIFSFLLVATQIEAAVNMRVVCLIESRQGAGSELVTIELAENQDWDLPQPGTSFPRVATRERHMLRVTHYRDVRRSNGQTLEELAQNVRPDQMIVAPMLTSGRMLGPALTFAITEPYLSADGQPLSQDRRFARITYLMPVVGEEFEAPFGFSNGGEFRTAQARCSRPHFYTVGGSTSFVPPADDGSMDSSTMLPVSK